MTVKHYRFIRYKKPLIFLVKLSALALVLAFMTLVAAGVSGCKKNEDTAQTQPSVSSSLPDNKESASTIESLEDEITATSENETTAASGSGSEAAVITTAETSGQVPDEINDLIEKAGNYYVSGEYGLAKNTYRKADIAIDDSSLSDDLKQSIKDSFYGKYNKAKEIIEAATMHYANAMQLEYEQRFDEAKNELEAALSLYPKYAEAIEAYDNLKAIMGLE